MGAGSVQQMAERIAALMEDRLGVRGRGLEEKLRRGGRKLPARVRAEAELLAEAAGQADNPRLLARLDHARVARAYEQCHKHLRRARIWERRADALLSLAGRLVLILFVVATLALALAWWRGVI